VEEGSLDPALQRMLLKGRVTGLLKAWVATVDCVGVSDGFFLYGGGFQGLERLHCCSEGFGSLFTDERPNVGTRSSDSTRQQSWRKLPQVMRSYFREVDSRRNRPQRSSLIYRTAVRQIGQIVLDVGWLNLASPGVLQPTGMAHNIQKVKVLLCGTAIARVDQWRWT
jgi:hypothetical protein